MLQDVTEKFRELRRRVPLLYIGMMVLTGMSIGAIAALSKTSVTNTLIEVVLVFVSGSAGLYYLNREALLKEGAAISAIGGIGILFLLAFWMTFVGVSLASPTRTTYAPWSKDRSLAENLAMAELRGHLARLGVNPDVATDLGSVSEALPPAAAGSCLADGDARGVALLVANSYRRAVQERCFVDQATHAAASFVAEDFQRLLAGDNAVGAAGGPDFDAASAALLALVGRAPDLAVAERLACAVAAADAEVLAQRVTLCREEPARRRLHLVRAHAEAFQSIWTDPVTVETVRTGIVMETLRNEGTDTDP